METSVPALVSRCRALVSSTRDALGELLSVDAIPRWAQYVALASIVVCTLVVRLDRIDAPALDRTAWKEIDYLMISENYWQHGFHFFSPEVSWPAEEPRATAMELPLVPFASALLYEGFGLSPLTARATTLFSFLVLIVYVFLLVRAELGGAAGVLAAIVSAFAGLRHPFGNFQFSEPPMIACSVIAIFHMAEWMQSQRWRDAVISCAAFSVAVALKLEPLYLLLPLSYLVWRRFGATKAALWRMTVFTLAALVLPIAWYAHAYALATHSIDVFGVFGGALNGGHDKFQTWTMLSHASWYREMVGRIQGLLLSGRSEFALAVLGIGALALMHRGGLILVYLATIGVYFGIVAEGQIDAPYRQLPIIPPLAACVAAGLLAVTAAGWSVARALKVPTPGSRGRRSLAVMVALCALLVLDLRRPLPDADPARSSWNTAWDFAQQIRSHVRPEDRLITAGEYSIHVGGNDLSPVLYYYTGLQGWTLQAPDWKMERVHELIGKGATLFAARDMDREPASAPFLDAMKASFPVLYEGDDGGRLLLRLTEPVPHESARPVRPVKDRS